MNWPFSKPNPTTTADDMPDRLHAASIAVGAALIALAERADELHKLTGEIINEFGRDAAALSPVVGILCPNIASDALSMAEGFLSTKLRAIAVDLVKLRALKAVGQ